MINLLPPDTKEAYRYAQRNVTLLHWATAFIIALFGLSIIAVSGALYMQKSISDNKKLVADSKTELAQTKQAETRAEVQDISNSFQLVVKVLSQQILFSKLLTQIAATIPANANLADLSIGQVQGGLDLKAIASDYNTATQVQVNLANPDNKIFSQADILNISCNSGAGADPRYPCTVTIRALFSPNNPYLFINGSGATR